MVDHSGWLFRRPLAEVADIDGIRSMTVVDRLARATVWSMTFDPAWRTGAPEPGEGQIDAAEQVRVADNVLDTVRAVELLLGAGPADVWFEVILISATRYHILRPFGASDDALYVELSLDVRANLAAARQMLDGLLSSHHRDRSLLSPAPEDSPASEAGLPRRPATSRKHDAVPRPARPVDDDVLHRVAASLRTINE